MVAEMVGCAFVALTLVGCVMIWIANLAMLGQLGGYLMLRRKGLAAERARLAQPLPPDQDLPDVVVQLPSFNEGPIVELGIANAIMLDWPKARLHIQVCDDSTDDTTDIARVAAAKAQTQGFDVKVIHRKDRAGFKAGSLDAAMRQTDFEFFAILDIDFVTAPDFLRRSMAVLLSDPDFAFVQTRMDFLNAGTNFLTRGQALMLDQHFAIDQPMRYWSGQAMPFNGTGGVWRRRGVDAGGGWRGETLSEDWELSYLARLHGMCGTFATSISAAGELPTDWRTWTTQQYRWAKGTGQVAWKMLPRVFTQGGMSAGFRLATLFPLALWFCYAMFTATYLLAIPAMLLRPSQALMLGLTVYLTYGATFWIMALVTWFASRAAGHHRSLGRFARDYLAVPMLSLYISWLHFRSIPAIVLGRRAVFERTPKQGSSTAVLDV
jgi:cellulose synthase/poly-beta-1,6-N-acetylglucosamine synthase-like glycosyltransferase